VRELDAAGITGAELRASYERCRRLHARHGKTYFLATLLLPPHKRPFVNALYGFARYADDIVDRLGADPQKKADELMAWSTRVLADLRAGFSDDPICRALVHTVRTWDIPLEHFEAFVRSMRLDLTVSEYECFSDLEKYMYGSAAVIGLQMVPILEPLTEEAADRAEALGIAFQLSNFLRDVGEDLDLGRLYLPREDLRKFDVDRRELEQRVVSPQIRELIRFEIDRTRQIYRYAEEGIRMLHPSSRDCIRTAFTLYGEILDAIEDADYQVLTGRVRVGIRRRVAVALPAYLRSRRARVTYRPMPAVGEA
jgi:phytoene synthase